jgi:hypothetical protein
LPLKNMDCSTDTDYLLQQFPYRLLRSDPQFCEWLSNMSEPFSEPFFDDTIIRLRSATQNQRQFKSLAAVELLPVWAAGTAISKSPTAIIFHVSRCGSTLLSQLLALQSQHMVLSEVPFLDSMLRLPHTDKPVDTERASALFHAALQLYVQSSKEQPEHLFIKSDSWHLHFYESLRTLYPGVPFVMLYRDPWEVLRSQQRRRGMQSVPGLIEPAVFGFTATEAAATDLDVYMASVLRTYFEKMIAIAAVDNACVLVNYNEGALAAMQKIAAATGMVLDAAYLEAISVRAGYHGKYPDEPFKEPVSREAAPDYLEPVMELYQQLDIIRQQCVANIPSQK